MDANVLDQMQTSYELFNGLGAIAGNLAIIKGCEITGSTVGDGLVYINGEVLEFRQNGIGLTVIVLQEAETKEFESGDEKEVYYKRYATFGSGTTSYNWADFKRVFPSVQIQDSLNTKEEKTVVNALTQRIQTLEQIAATIPKIKVDTGSIQMGTGTNGQNQNNFTMNTAVVQPPAGYNMNHLVGFMPSIQEIFFSGDVDGNDTIWCKYRKEATQIRIICSNSESRAQATVNYMGVWIKY